MGDQVVLLVHSVTLVVLAIAVIFNSLAIRNLTKKGEISQALAQRATL